MEKSTFSPLYQILCAHLIALRRAAGLTQRALAKILERERSFVARIEQGERRIDLVEFFWICRACGSDPKATAHQIMSVLERATHRVPSRERMLEEALTWVREHRAPYAEERREES